MWHAYTRMANKIITCKTLCSFSRITLNILTKRNKPTSNRRGLLYKTHAVSSQLVHSSKSQVDQNVCYYQYQKYVIVRIRNQSTCTK